MKRMSEVFELPLKAPAVADDELFDDRSKFVGEMTGRNYARHAAHAINHVDALADALDACVKVLGQMPAGEPVNDSDRAFHRAVEALNAYRGAK